MLPSKQFVPSTTYEFYVPCFIGKLATTWKNCTNISQKRQKHWTLHYSSSCSRRLSSWNGWRASFQD